MHINDLSKLCQVDQLSNKICNDPHFWKLYFKKHDLPFDIINIPTSIKGWINAFIITYWENFIAQFKTMLLIDSDMSDDYDGDEINLWLPQDFNDINDVD